MSAAQWSSLIGIVGPHFCSFVLGSLSSLLAWWIIYAWMGPSLSISAEISCMKGRPEDQDNCGWTYRIKFENSGRRGAIDIQVHAYVRVKSLTSPTIWDIVRIPFTVDGETVHPIALMGPVRRSHLRTILRLYPNSIASIESSRFPAWLRSRAKERIVRLEDLLCLGTAAELVVIIFAFDQLTGGRKVFRQTYGMSNFKIGPFIKNGLSISVVQHPASTNS